MKLCLVYLCFGAFLSDVCSSDPMTKFIFPAMFSGTSVHRIRRAPQITPSTSMTPTITTTATPGTTTTSPTEEPSTTVESL